MNNFILHLNSSNEVITLPLFQKESEDFFDNYYDKGSGEYVHNDYAYSVFVTNEYGDTITIDNLFVNDEMIDNKAFISGRKHLFIFLECFGVIKIEVIIGGNSFVTQNSRVVMKDENINSNLINMIGYIYDHCDKYLYEVHESSKTGVGVMPNKNISIDTKLALLNEIYDVYIKSYNLLKHSAQNKLEGTHRIGNFNELQGISQNTIYHIVYHPEELQPVNYNSGISVNKQYFEPRKTLIQSVAYSCNIYENQIIVGFLKTIIRDLKEIKSYIEVYRNRNYSPYKRNGYVDSAYYIYTRNMKMLNNYTNVINDWLVKMQKLYIEYKRILNVSDLLIVSAPRYTNIFRRIMPYNIIIEKIIKWFNCGNYDLTKSDLLLSFVSISKIYEYFCLLKINNSLEKCGYNLVSEFPYKYEESRYYKNTIYNNTFEFSKNDINVTVYFQPVIYGKVNGKARPNKIDLFRNTSISIKEPTILAMLDEQEAQCGNSYTPDYLIKISRASNTNYYIIDAKHSNPNNIKRYQLPYLAFKYLFSISALTKETSIAGMCILCGKSTENSMENIYDIANGLNIPITPLAHICCITGDDVDNDADLIDYINKIEKETLCS